MKRKRRKKIGVVSWFEFKSPSIWISVIDRRETKKKVTVIWYSISVLEIKELILFIALTTKFSSSLD